MSHEHKNKVDLQSFMAAPMAVMLKRQKQRQAFWATQFDLGRRTASLMMKPNLNLAEIGQDMLAMQSAIMNQANTLSQAYLTGLQNIQQEFVELQHVNTLTKMADQEAGIAGQALALNKSQMTSWLQLMENIQVNYGYWLQQQESK